MERYLTSDGRKKVKEKIKAHTNESRYMMFSIGEFLPVYFSEFALPLDQIYADPFTQAVYMASGAVSGILSRLNFRSARNGGIGKIFKNYNIKELFLDIGQTAISTAAPMWGHATLAASYHYGRSEYERVRRDSITEDVLEAIDNGINPNDKDVTTILRSLESDLT